MSADPARVALAHQVLAQPGVSLADLQTGQDSGDSHAAVVMPTIDQYLPRVVAAAGPGAARTYGSYWARMVAAWGDRPVDSIDRSRPATSNPCNGRRSRSPAGGGPTAVADTPANT